MNVSDTSGYRIFPISISKKLSNKEAYIYLSLLFKSDYKTGESNVLLETLSKETGYDSETVSGYLHKAKEYRYIEITQKTCGKKEDGSTKTKNFYKIHIPQKDFIMVNREFLDFHIENLSIKEETDLKGFILLIKCICLNNCNFTYYSLRDMTEHLTISYATIQKLMKKCRDLELITYHKKYYKIMFDYFDLGNTGYAEMQLGYFDRCCNRLLEAFDFPIMRHILNTDGILRFPEHQYEMVRLGIGLYGVPTLGGGWDDGLRTVSSLRSVIIQIREWEAGTAIGYGCNGVLSRKSRIATIPVGYADGFSRRLGNGAGEVYVNGRRVPTVGNICMDLFMADVTDVDCKVGDKVELFGEHITASETAGKLGTIPYEVLTSVSERVKRIYYRE